MSNITNNTNLPYGSVDYLIDFVRWTEHQAQLLREGRLDELDRENLIEEIESIGQRDKRELSDRLCVLIATLLRHKFYPQGNEESLRSTIVEQRIAIEYIIEDSPSLKRGLAARLEKAYPTAVRIAAQETGSNEAAFPNTSPFSADAIFDEDFFP
ncbi:DUF29 domain-containing protein [Massilia cavernae]|uniref:DUF29 domain-containing protein n=1 Tax=Massilia cavernae TaxID=2320864 RepID=A0A418XGE9_9BURK|nr:DUF29 domain-containing protein [Massilia cavernae]RJG11531.1 DUF29 domain-containing protein [Massilia cavernae]